VRIGQKAGLSRASPVHWLWLGGSAPDSSSGTFLVHHHPSAAWSRRITLSLSSTSDRGLGFEGSIRSACRSAHSIHSNTLARSVESVLRIASRRTASMYARMRSAPDPVSGWVLESREVDQVLPPSALRIRASFDYTA